MRRLKSSIWAEVVLWVLLFLLAFVLRTTDLRSTGRVWLRRSVAFQTAIQDRDWASTFQRRHPGVTTMALGAGSLWLYDQLEDTPAEAVYTWAIPPETTDDRADEIVSTMAVAFAISFFLCAIGWVLKQIGGWRLGLTGFGLLVISPYYL